MTRFTGVALLAALASAFSGCRSEPPPPPSQASATVSRLTASRTSPGATGRAGDLLLDSKQLGVLTFAAHLDALGQKPLRGALVDVGLDSGDRSDALVWWRPGWRTSDGTLHVGPMQAVDEVDCHGVRGIHLGGVIDGVSLDTSICPTLSGYRAVTAARGLPDGAAMADEVNAGASRVLTEGAGAHSDGDRASSFFAVGDDVAGWLLECSQMHVNGKLVHIGEQAFQSPFTLEYPGPTAIRTFRVVAGDGLDLLAQVVGSMRRVYVGLQGEPGRVAILDEAGKPIVLGELPASGRDLTLPAGVGTDLVLYDENGVEAGRAALEDSLERLVVKPPPRAELAFRYTDDAGAPLPVHVVFRGLAGTRDPSPVARAHAFAAGRSLYLAGGTGTVALPPGRYRVTATHGTRFTLSVMEIEARAGEAQTIAASLRDVMPAASWTSGDFHLHAAPSPDAPVSLDARVASLVCEGVDFAVATDHNRVTDYGPSVDRLGVGSRIVTTPGDEITTYGAHPWGHFNVYPLPSPSGDSEATGFPYYDIEPAAIFAAAHEGGSTGERILQVNHARMEPRLGYFDLTHLDARTGAADPTFSGNFDALEVFNGFWITNPVKIREGAVDLVALARRGVHVAATGNSDSHHLLYEEAGYARTYVHVAREPIATRKERVLAAIHRGDTTVSSGPLVEMTVDGLPIGSVVVPKRGHDVHVHVRVSAPAWVPVEHVEIWHDDRVAFQVDVTRTPVDGLRYEADAVLSFPVDGTLLAWATADSPLPDVLPYPNARATGFTGLVYVDANGDGKVDVPPR